MAEQEPRRRITGDTSATALNFRGPRLLLLYLGIVLLGLLVGGLLALAVADHSREARPSGGVMLPPQVPRSPEEQLDSVVFSVQPDRPDRTADLLPAEAPEILCFYDLPDLPATTQIEAYWWLNGEELGQVHAAMRPVPKAKHAVGQFILNPPHKQKTFPEGIYEVELRAAGKKITRASLVVARDADKILSAKPTAVGQIKVVNCVTARGADAKGQPRQPTATFADRDRIFVVFTYINGTTEAAFVVKWFFQDVLIEQATQRVAMSDGAGRAFAWLQADEPLPAGQYRAAVGLAGEEAPLAEVQFIVKP